MNTKIRKRLLSLLMAFMTALSLCVPVSAAETTTAVSTVVDTVLKDTMAQEKSALPGPRFGDEWVLLGFARSGYLEKGSKYFDDYYNRVVTDVDKKAKNALDAGAPAGALHLVKCTENSRLIITLSAIGRDARKVGNWDLVAPYENFSWIKGQGLNSVSWALTALDSGSYETKDTTIRQQCIDYILGRQLSDGGWDYNENATSADPDMTAMMLQSLSRYQNQEKVKTAIDRAVDTLSRIQNADGSYSSYDAANSESTSQVITACVALGIDPHRNSRFVKGGKSAVDALLTFYDTGKKAFHHVMEEKDGKATDVDGMATEQAVYAMTAYQRLVNKKTSLYDMSDVVKDCADGQHTFGEWKEATAATCTEPGTKMRTCTKCGRSEFQNSTPALGHKQGSNYEMNDSKHWYPCTVCGAHLKEASHTYTGDQCAICNYHKVGGRIQISQLSTLPSALKDVDAVNSFDKLKSEMTASVQKVDKDIKAGNTKLLDVKLLIPSVENNKTVWSLAAKSAFPSGGKIKILLPYPSGTGQDGYEFVVVHTFTTSDFGKTKGDMESPTVTKTADGLLVTTTGLSPIMIGWKSGTDSAVEKMVKAAKTGDTSQIGLWIGCILVSAGAITVLIKKKKRMGDTGAEGSD